MSFQVRGAERQDFERIGRQRSSILPNKDSAEKKVCNGDSL